MEYPSHKKRSASQDSDRYQHSIPNKRSRTTKSVRDHYNDRENQTRAERNKSTISSLRKFNNWIKSVLIKEYCHEGDCVMDICGGKGGDLRKWLESRISYLVLTDIAEVSLRHAIDRYNQMANSENKKIERMPSFNSSFICANCHKPGLLKELDKLEVNFDLVSCQFALHYSFETKESAKQFLRNVSYKLKPNGFFIATLPSAARIVDKIKNSSDGLHFGNQYYKIEFPIRDNFPRFGAKYTFTLEDAIDGIPEYLVNHDTLVELALECGLEFKKKQNFQNYYNDTRTTQYENLERIVRDGKTGPLEPDFWEIAGIYNIYVFQKSSDPAFRPPEVTAPQPPLEFRICSYGDIIQVDDGGEGIIRVQETSGTAQPSRPPPRVPEKPSKRPPPRNGPRYPPKEFHDGPRYPPKEFHDSRNRRRSPSEKGMRDEFHPGNSRNGRRDSTGEKGIRQNQTGNLSPVDGVVENESPGDLKKEVVENKTAIDNKK